MKWTNLFPRFTLLAATTLSLVHVASAQNGAPAGTLLPVPFVTTIAGLAGGSGNTQCTTGTQNQSAQSLGDGCLPTQATLVGQYDVQVDAAGNVYTSENGTSNDIRVIYYGGAATAALLMAANPAITTPPVVGNIYTIAGGTASAFSATSKVYYCGFGATSGQQGLDTQGNGCPAAQSYLKPRGFAIDANGNIFTTNTGSGNNLRVIYAGGAQVAALITKENPTVTAPKVGAIYRIAGGTSSSYSGDGGLAINAFFVGVRYVTVDTLGNLYVSDGTTQTTVVTNGVSTVIEAAANNVRRIDGVTGIITTVAGQNNCTYVAATGCSYGFSGDGGPGSGALLSTPYTVFTDVNNNLYIADYYNGRIRVVYAGGTVAGLTNPVVGNIYTYAGGGTSTANGTVANQVSFGSLYVAGIDRAGNIYAEDGTSKVIWRFDAKTAVGNIIAGGKSSTSVAKAGAFCTGTAGPKSLDNFGDGCPALQGTITDTGTIAFDNAGNFYLAENGNAVVRELSYNTQFGSAATGATTVRPLAFEATAATTLGGESFALQGGTTTEFADAGGSTCVGAAALTANTICTFNVTFAPAHAGLRAGTAQFGTAAGAALSYNISGTGVASDLAIDTGTQSTLTATGTTAAGVAADLLGNVFVADSTGNRVLKGASTGTALTPLITGLNKPSAVAVDNAGNVYVADTGNNRVLETNASGATLATLGSGLSAPRGVAVDGVGNVYVSDSGTNRVLQVFANGNQQVLPVTGLAAPAQLATDSAGNLYIVDAGNKRIVEYGGVNGQTTVALDAGVVPAGVAVDPAGTIYVADSASGKLIAYPAGSISGDVLASGFTTLAGLASDADGNLFAANGTAGVTQLRRSLGNITFPLTNVGSTTTQSISVSNAGNAPLTFSTPLTTVTGSALFTVAPSTSNGCGAGISYVAGAGCNFTASYSPVATGSNTATVKFNTNATNTGTASALLSGTGLLLVKTTTAISVAPAGTLYFGQTVTLTATLTPATTTVAPTGTYTYVLDGKTQSAQPVGTPSLAVNLAAGSHTVSVTYSGDGVYASSAASVTFTINKAVTTTTLTVAPVNNSGALSLLFTATVVPTTGAGLTGTVSFYAGTALIGTSNVTNGVATLSTAALSFTNNSLTAVYNGSTNFATSTSAVVGGTGGGDFAIGSATTTLTTSQGGVANISFSLASLFGGSGTVTPSCTGLPDNSVCRFQPLSMTLGTTGTQTESILVYTNVLSTLAANPNPGFFATGRGMMLAFGLPLGLGLLTLRRRKALGVLAMVVLGVAVTGGLSGCGNPASATNASAGLVTPAGTYAMNIVFTGSNGFTGTHTVPATLKVVANTTPF